MEERLVTIILALLVNFAINSILNKELLSSRFNAIIYLLIWLSSAAGLMLINYLSDHSEQLQLVYYGAVGFSIPQIAVIALTANKYKKDWRQLDELKQIHEVIHARFGQFWITSIPKFLNMKLDGMSDEEFLERSEKQIPFIIKRMNLDKNQESAFRHAIEKINNINN